jgi:hypothetical protein
MHQHGQLKIGARVLSWMALLVIGLWGARQVYAADLKSASAQFAEQSFALLDRVSNQRGDKPNPLLGPVASFAGDADSLRHSLAHDDLRSANSNIVSLQADCSTIDQTLGQHPDALAAEQWRTLKEQFDRLARAIPPSTAGSAALSSATSEAKGKSDSAPPVGAAGPGSPSAMDVTEHSDAPRIVIASRETDRGFVRLKGYFEGRALKSAGIYEGPRRLKALKVVGVPGRERVEFDLRLGDPSPATILRVSDAEGRTVEAPALDPTLQPPVAAEEYPGSATPAVSAAVGEPWIKSRKNGDTAEIPSHGPLRPSPSKRQTLSSNLGDVRINIRNVTQTGNLPPAYEIVGQIAGRGITRAGIYLDGRLLQRIPVARSANSTNFDQRIVAQGGAATIRAYGVGDQFVEQSVDLFDAEDASFADTRSGAFATTAPAFPSGIAVQISAIRPVAGNLYVVSGIISGADVVSAGLYQNGVLAQNINLGSGLTGVLGALIGGNSRSINFDARFNPYAGPASIRAFSSTGAYSEQPIMVAGMAPYGRSWPNSPSYGNGWPSSPSYGSGSPNSPPYGSAGNFPYRGGLGTGPHRSWPAPSHPPW